MDTDPIEVHLGSATLKEAGTLKLNGLDVIFQSNGRLNAAGKPEATIQIGIDDQRIIVTERFPPWVDELIAGRAGLSDKHFRITLPGGLPENCKLEIVEERLEQLVECDIYRDGGSYGASWITNYGALWELFLRTSNTGVGDPDRSRRHTYLYNTGANSHAHGQAVLKGTDAEAAIMMRLNDWFDRPALQGRTNRETMHRYSRLDQMCNSMSWRMY